METRRLWKRGAASSLVALLVLCVIGTGALPATADSNPAGHRPARITLKDIAPTAPRKDSTLRISGRVTAGDTAVSGVTVRLRFSSSPFRSRGLMDAYAAGRHSSRYGTKPLWGSEKTVTDKLRPGRSEAFTLTVPVHRLGFSQFGVYPIAVEVRSGGRRLAITRTFLPYVDGDGGTKPTHIAWLWPLAAAPYRDAGGDFLGRGLRGSLDEDGKLGRLLAAARNAPAPKGSSSFPLVWAIDPALLEAASQLRETESASPSPSGSESSGDEDGGTAPTAKTWLSHLRAATSGHSVISMPYAEPDVMALHRAGLDDDLHLAFTKGEDIVQSVLRRQVKANVAWPPEGWINQDTLDTLAGAGTNTVILNERSLPPATTPTYTPNAATSTTTVGGSVDALIADSTITGLLAKVGRTKSAVLAEQRFLAETALITDQRPSVGQKTILAAPPRRWSPPPGFAADLLTDTAQVPWLHAVGTSYLKEHPSTVPRGPLRYPQKARAKELSQDYLDKVAHMDRRLERFAAIVDERPSPFDLAILRTESSAWRTRPEKGRKLRDAVGHKLTSSTGKVRIISGGRAKLASKSGTIPVTISNGLTEHAVTVRLRLRPHNRARIHFRNYVKRLRIRPEHKVTTNFHATAATSGVGKVYLQLLTPNGKEYGAPVTLKVQPTGYGSTALEVTGGALAVLFLAAAARLIRRSRRRDRRQDGEDGGDWDETGGTEGTKEST